MKWHLAAAELTTQGYAEDVFRVLPEATRDPSVEIAVTHVHRPSHASALPVVMLHGEFSNRSQWYRQEEECLARDLLEQRCEVWLPEMPGHGLSPPNRAYCRNSLRDQVVTDLPALREFVSSSTGRAALWVGCGLGALALLAAIEAGRLERGQIRGLVLVGLDDVSMLWRRAMGSPWSRWRAKRTGVIQASRCKGLGSALENEPWSLIASARDYRFEGLPRFAGMSPGPPLLLIEASSGKRGDGLLSEQVIQAWGVRQAKRIVVDCLPADLPDSPAALKAIRSAIFPWMRGWLATEPGDSAHPRKQVTV